MEEHVGGATASNRRWVQVNNTVVPVVQRASTSGSAQDYIPLPVVRHGAGLFTDRHPDVVTCTPSERRFLSGLCLDAGFKFDFPEDTELILLDAVTNRYRGNVYVTRLPDRDPFSHAEFWPDCRRASGSDRVRTSLADKRPVRSGRDTKDTGPSRMEQRQERGRDNKAAGGIWRPISFSPDRLERSDHKLSSNLSDPDKPLDLSLRGRRTQHKPATNSSGVNKLTKKVCQTSSVLKSNKADIDDSVRLRERYLMGQHIITTEKNNTEYVSLASLRCVFFPSVPMDMFLHIISATEGPALERKAPAEGRPKTSEPSRYLLFDDKLIELRDAERTMIGVGAFLHAMASCQLAEPAPLGYCPPGVPCVAWPAPPPGGPLQPPERANPLVSEAFFLPPLFDGMSPADKAAGRLTSGI